VNGAVAAVAADVGKVVVEDGDGRGRQGRRHDAGAASPGLVLFLERRPIVSMTAIVAVRPE
jgi:hypothetical protein